MVDRGRVIVITGAMAAGKSTVAELLARRLPASVHIRGDVFRKMVVNGRVDMTPDAGPEAMAQLHLRYALAGHTADTYAAAGFDAIVQDVIIGAELRRLRRPDPDPGPVPGRPLPHGQRAWSGGNGSGPRRATPTSPPVRWTRCCAGRPPRSATGSTRRHRPRTRPSTTSSPTWNAHACSHDRTQLSRSALRGHGRRSVSVARHGCDRHGIAWREWACRPEPHLHSREAPRVTDPSPSMRLARLLDGFLTTQLIYTAARLRLDEVLAGGPQTGAGSGGSRRGRARSRSARCCADSSASTFSTRTTRAGSWLTPIGVALAPMRSAALIRGDLYYAAAAALPASVLEGGVAFRRDVRDGLLRPSRCPSRRRRDLSARHGRAVRGRGPVTCWRRTTSPSCAPSSTSARRSGGAARGHPAAGHPSSAGSSSTATSPCRARCAPSPLPG